MVISDITLPNSNTRSEKLLREFSEETLPERTTLAAKTEKATRGLGDANFSRKSHVRMHESTNRKRKTELYLVLLEQQYSSTVNQSNTTPKINIIPHL